MYDLGRKVYVKRLNCVGYVRERRYLRPLGSWGKRLASYDVETPEGRIDATTGNLNAADDYCDGCEKWRPRSSFIGGTAAVNPFDDVVEARFCFLCTREANADYYG